MNYKTNLHLYFADMTGTYLKGYSYIPVDYSTGEHIEEEYTMVVTKYLYTYYGLGPDYYLTSYNGKASSRGVNGRFVTLECN